MSGVGRERILHCSDPDKVGNGHEHHANRDKKNHIGDEIREDHEGYTTHQRHDRALLLAVHEKPDSNGPKKHRPKK
jgi:hypothetical protein